MLEAPYDLYYETPKYQFYLKIFEVRTQKPNFNERKKKNILSPKLSCMKIPALK